MDFRKNALMIPILCSLLAGCEHSSEMHRFAKGDTWKLQIHSPHGSDSIKVTILPDEMKAPDGTLCMVLKQESTTASGKTTVAEGAFHQDTNGSELLYGIPAPAGGVQWGRAPHPYSVRIKAPLKVGDFWGDTIETPDGKQQVFNAVVDKKESVTVPAGTFEAYRLTEIDRFMKDKKVIGGRTNEVWIAPSIGFPIKQTMGYDKTMTTIELTSSNLH